SERALRRAGNNTDDIFALAADGDAAACDLLQKQAFYTGLALANLVNVFNPELIVLGGIFAQAKDIFLPTIRETMAQYAFAAPGEEIRLALSPSGRDAGMIGASALVLDRYFYRQTELS
ncbi:MAG: ROK family protein, partial [Aggregatilineales bacterium]